ncbi:hypothetical protein Q3G72_006609 [Acer saccharum]|nr:hypothetical protein Q3G72_006609 [Acer saccharum]
MKMLTSLLLLRRSTLVDIATVPVVLDLRDLPPAGRPPAAYSVPKDIAGSCKQMNRFFRLEEAPRPSLFCRESDNCPPTIRIKHG